MKKIITLPVLMMFLVGGLTFAAGDATKSGKATDVDEISEKKLSSLSEDEIVSKSSDSIDGMREILSTTQSLLQKARDEKEGILTINCINQQLAAMKGFVKVSEQQAATIAKDKDRKVQEQSYRLIFISADRVDGLYDEALNCTGEAARFAHQKVIDRKVDNDIADIEVIEIDDDRFDDDFATEREPELTPYQ